MNNLDDIQNEKYDELKSRNIDKEPNYGKVVIENVPEDKVIIIGKDYIEIVKGDKIVRLDKDLDIEVKGEVTLKAKSIKVISENGNINVLEGLVSYTKLNTILNSAIGNFGQPITYLVSPSIEENMTYSNIKIAIGS